MDASEKSAPPRVALQLYTVREAAKKDFDGTLRAVAAMGYPAVQLAGEHGLSSGELRDRLRELNLAVAGNHLTLERLRTALDEEIALIQAVGSRDLVLSVTPLPMRGSRDGYHRLADQLNEVGERCRAASCRLSYHNHDWEFDRFDGRYALDLLLEWTDPGLVYFEPDVYWIKRGGVDPAEYLRQHAGRIPLVHLKDMADDETRSFAEVGSGLLDFPSIFAAAESGGAEWYVVEQDRCPGPELDSARTSLENLRRWGKL
jgi:sugar phosphate isomerase/epimerase